MNRKKKTVLVLISAIFFLSLSACLVILYWQYRGLPQGLQRQFWHELQVKGLVGDADEIKAGLFGGVVLKNLVIRDYSLPAWTLLTADTVEIRFNLKSSLRGTIRVARVEVSGCTISLPLELSGGEVLRKIVLTNLSFAIRDAGAHLDVVSFSGLVEGIQLNLGGDVIKPTDEEIRRLRLKNKDFELKLSILPWVRLLSSTAVEQISNFQEFCRSTEDLSKATVSLDVHLRVGDFSKSRLTTNIFFSNFLYRGLKLDTLLLIADVKGDRIRLSELNLKMDNGEYLNGNFNLDVEHREISGQLQFYGYPEKLLKALSPDLLVAPPIDLPDFSHIPVSAKITVHPSAVDVPSDWNLDVDLTLADTNIADATVKALSGRLHYENRLVNLTKCKVVVAPDIQINATGTYSLDDNGIYLEAEVDGEPHFVSSFSTDEKFKNDYTRVWRDFEWEKGGSPHFDVVLEKDENFPRSGLVLQVRSSMQNVTYNGVRVDRVEGTVLVDFPAALMLIDNVKVTRGSESARLNLAWHGLKDYVDFDLEGTLDPPLVLGMFNRSWINFLEGVGITFDANPRATATGHIDLSDSRKTKIDVTATGSSMIYKDASLHNFDSTITIRHDEIYIDGTIAQLQFDDWTAIDIIPQLKIGPERATVTGTIGTVTGFGVSAGTSSFDALCTKDAIDITSSSEFVKFGDGRFNHVEATSIYKPGILTSRATGKTAELLEFGANDATVEFSVFDEQIVAELRTDSSIEGQDYQFSDIRGACVIRDGFLSLTGNIAEVRHLPTDSYSPNIQVNCDYGDADLDTTFFTHSISRNDSSVDDMSVTLRFRDGIAEGSYNVGKLTLGNGYGGRNIQGDLRINKGGYEFQSIWETASTPVCKLRVAVINGTYSSGRWAASVDAEQCPFYNYPLENLSAAVIYKNNDLSVNRVTASLHGGRATGEYFYDHTEDTAKLWLTVVGADFTKLTRAMKSMDDGAMAGSFSAKVDLNIADVTGDYQLNGKGKVLIEKGDFWRVPLFSDFMTMVTRTGILGKVIPGGGLGKITELRTDIEFAGDRLYFPNLKTNGSLIAIVANGNYWWKTRNLDFRVTAEPLNLLLGKILPRAIDPFAILLERRLSGKLEDPKWEEISAIRDLFRQKEGAIQ